MKCVQRLFLASQAKGHHMALSHCSVYLKDSYKYLVLRSDFLHAWLDSPPPPPVYILNVALYVKNLSRQYIILALWVQFC